MVIDLGMNDREAVIDVLAESFWDYPVMRYVLADSGDGYPKDIRTLIGMFVDGRLLRGWPVLGIREGDELAAAIVISDPDPKPLPDDRVDLEDDVRAAIGEPAWERIEAFEAVASNLEAGESHYYVGMIGVSPSRQGAGLSRILMKEAIRMSTDDPRSQGVGLSTEVETNVPYYEHLGFSVIGEAAVDDLRTWSFFLSTP